MVTEIRSYGAYIASRDWALKKEAVRNRSGGICERCRVGPHEQTHHLTYENVGDEDLDEIIGICRPCHEFLSGKRHRDPIALHHCHSGWDKTISYLFSACITKSEIDEMWKLLELP